MQETFSPQLNVRTGYNFQESIIKIEDYVNFASRHHFPYLFYADKFVMHGAADFTAQAINKKIKPILGLTLEINSQIVILIAKDNVGYRNLSYISSLTIDKKLEDWNDVRSLIKTHLTNNLLLVANFEDGQKLFKEDIQEKNTYFTDDLPLISYLYPHQKESLKAALALKQGTTIDQVDLGKATHYLSDQELSQHFNTQHYHQILDQIAKQVNFNLLKTAPLAKMMIYPTQNNLDSQAFLSLITNKALTQLSLQKKLDSKTKEVYQKRLNYELKTIHQMGFDDYFLVVWDYVNYAHQSKIIVGPGRGSAASSLVSYLLKITAIDPIEYNLYFERFLNPERRSLPDIDIDFQDNRRNEVVQYLVKKYGHFHVALVGTFQTIGAKLAIRDVGRALGINLESINAISKNLPNNLSLSNFEKIIKQNDILKAYAIDYPQLFVIAKDLIGLPRQTGIHAAGVVISNDDLRDFVPLKLNYDGLYQTQYDMTFLENLGLIKMDLLGLKNLSILKMIQDNIEKNQDKKIDYHQLPLNDKSTFELLNKKQTSGIFQLESPGMTRVIEQVQVNSIQDISDVSALFRPGPQEMIAEYVANKNGKAMTQDRIHQALSLIFKDTYGVMVYQEQVLQALQKIANFSLGKADLVRRAMSKKNFQTMKKSKSEFLESAIKNGYQKGEASEIWNWIEQFAGYGFNKSHSIAYSYLSYWLTYYKTHYPLEFYGALLTSVIGNEIKTAQYLSEAQALGLKLESPSLKNMISNYVIRNHKLYLPLTLIKGVSYEFIRKLKEQYQNDNHLFQSIFYFMSQLINHGLNSTTFPALVWTGAFDFFGYPRATLIANQRQLFDFALLNSDSKTIDESLVPEMLIVPDNNHQLETEEKKYFGFTLKTSSLAPYRYQLKDLDLVTIREAKKIIEAKQRVLGEIVNIKIIIDRKNKEMAFITFKDETGIIEATMFSSLYPKFKALIHPHQIVIADITIKLFESKPKANVWKLEIPPTMH